MINFNEVYYKSVLKEADDEGLPPPDQQKFDQRRKLIVDGLNSIKGIQCSLPGGAFYVFPNISGTGMNGKEFVKKCLNEAGVAIVPGTAFGKNAVNYVRFSFAASKENISMALDRINKVIK